MKKFLSLVLALVMTMSLVTVSAGAKGFTDSSKINYKEAVDVMSAVKVIDGYAEGDFRPSNTLTRGAAAKIICNLILGPTTASALVADTAPYSDVPTTNNFAGYIAYCAKEKIISGYADGTFRPANTLSGYAFMKMLLGALGYDATTEGYTGPNWSINVAKRALHIELDDGLNGEFNGTKAVTREEACLYAFNTLKATMVEYENNNSVTVNGITFTNKSTAKEMANTGKTDGNIKDDGKMQFAEKYFSKLSKKPANDDFKRPATKWVYDGDSVGTYADSADAAVTLGSAKDFKTVLTDSDYMNYDSGDVKADAVVYVNGFEAGTYKDLKSVKLGVGDVVEAFENDDDDVTRIVVIRYLPAQIDEIDDDLSSSYTKKGASYSISFKAVDKGEYPTDTYYDKYTNDSDKELPGFDAKTYVEDAVVALAPEATKTEESKGKLAVTYGKVILDSYVAEKVSGAIKTYSTKDQYAYVDGTKYKFAANFDGVDTGYDKGTTYDLYTTKEGYALAIIGVDDASLDDVYYVIGVYKASSSYDTNTFYAQVVNVTTGEKSEIKLESAQEDASFKTAIENSGKGSKIQAVKGLYTFEDKKVEVGNTTCKANNGKFNAYFYMGDSDFSYGAAYSSSTATALKSDVTKDSTSVTLNSASIYVKNAAATTGNLKKYITSTTKFLTVEGQGDDLSVTTATGLQKCAKDDADVAIIIFEKDSNKAAYVLYAGDSFDGKVGTDDVLYLNSDGTFNMNNDKDTVATDGAAYFMDTKEAKDIVLTGKYYTGSTKYEDAAGFYTYTTDKDDIYTLTEVSYINSTVDTDKTDGYAKDLVVTSYEDSSCVLSGEHFDDVSYKNAVVIDARGGDADDDVYTGTINSVSALNKALNKIDNYTGWTTDGIKLSVCVEDGKITFIVVTEVKDAAKATEGEEEADATIKSVSLDASKNVTVTLTAKAAKDTKYTVVVEKYMEATDKWVSAATTTVTVTAGNTTATGTVVLASNGIYRATCNKVVSENVTIG